MATEPTELARIVAQNLQTAMDRRGLDDRELAKLSGIARKTVNNIRNSRHNATLDTIESLAKTLDVESATLTSLPTADYPSGKETHSKNHDANLGLDSQLLEKLFIRLETGLQTANKNLEPHKKWKVLLWLYRQQYKSAVPQEVDATGIAELIDAMS